MKIKLHDKTFVSYMQESAIEARVKELALKLQNDYHGEIPVFVVLLNGAYWFTTDLLKHYNGDAEVCFIKYKSYHGTESTGTVKKMMGIDIDITGRHVVIVEDIIDTGKTLHEFLKEFAGLNPKSVKIASLLLKPNALQYDIKADYIGFEIPNDFIVGYGLDYDGLGRNYKDIYVLEA